MSHPKPDIIALIRWEPCYCGGWLKWEFTRHKRKASLGWIYFHYAKPRWQLVNCYPKIRL